MEASGTKFGIRITGVGYKHLDKIREHVKLCWPVGMGFMRSRIMGFLTFAVVAAGVVVGAYAGVRYAAGGSSPPEGEPPFPIPTDVPASAQLPVEAADIQLGPDGNLFVPDRGDACVYEEAARVTFESQEWVMLSSPVCELGWAYAAASGEVRPVPLVTPVAATPEPPYLGPTPTPAPFPCPTPKPGQSLAAPAAYIELGADGKYFRPDVGDGCVYQEASRFAEQGQEWVLLQSATCEPDMLFAPATGEVRALVPPLPTPAPPVTPEPSPTPPIKGVPRTDLPSPSEIQLGPDGKYYIPERGDGCPWAESGRFPQPDGTLKILLETECSPNLGFWYFPETGEIILVVS